MTRKEMTPKELAWEEWKASATTWTTEFKEEREMIAFENWWLSIHQEK